MSRSFLLSLLAGLVLSASALAQTAPNSHLKVNIIIDRETIRFAPQELAVEMRLVVNDQAGAELYDSGPVPVSTLDWLMRDSKGEAVKGGLYVYTLTLKDAAGESSARRGYLIVNRTGDSDRVYVATADKVGIGAGSAVTQVTVIGSPEATVGGAELPGAERGNYVASGRSLSSLSERIGMQHNAQGRNSAVANDPISARQPARLAPNGTANRLAKFAFDGEGLVDTQVSESNGALLVGNASATGNIQIFGPANADVFAGMGPDVANGPAFNYGYAGSSFGRSAGFFNVRPDASAVAPNPSLRFLTANQQRMIITNTGDVGVGTSSPATRLDVVHPGTQVRFGPSTADNGGYLLSTNPTQAIMSAGASWNGADWIAKGTVASLTAHQAGEIQFYTNSGLTVGNTFAPIQRMRIEANGNIRIGNTNPNVTNNPKVYVVGEFDGIRGETDKVNYAGVFGINTAGGYAGLFDGKVVVNGNVCANNLSCASDVSLKQQVRSLDYGLSQLMRLRPVRWQWKDPATKQLTFGLIAQEVEPILPELILRDADPAKPLGLNYLGLLPVVIKALQEQQAALEQKDATIKALEQRNAELDARLTVVEQTLKQLLGQPGQAQPTKRQQ